jgi:hypothetical protein
LKIQDQDIHSWWHIIENTFFLKISKISCWSSEDLTLRRATFVAIRLEFFWFAIYNIGVLLSRIPVALTSEAVPLDEFLKGFIHAYTSALHRYRSTPP